MADRRIQRRFLAYRDHGRADDLAAVFDACAPGLYGLARHVLPTAQDADDVLQATFLAAMEHADRFDPEQPIRPWLAGILVNQARRHVAKESRPIREDELAPRAAVDPGEAARRSELEAELDSALGKLASRDREVLEPLLKSGEAPASIASALGLAPGTVRVRIHRAMARLRKALPAGYAAAGASVAPNIGRVRQAVLRSAPKAAPAKAVALATGGGSATLGLAALAVIIVIPVAWAMFAGGDETATAERRLAAKSADLEADRSDALATSELGPETEREAVTTEAEVVPTTGVQAPATEPAATTGDGVGRLRIVGRVESSDGGAGEATVGIVAPDEDGEISTMDSITVQIGEEFELESSVPSARVVAVAKTYAPVVRAFDAEGLEVVDVGALVVAPGATIEGVAYGNEEGATDGANGRVFFKHADLPDAERIRLGRHALGWVDDHCFVASGEVEVAADHRFRIEGLDADAYDLLHMQRSQRPMSSMHDAKEGGVRVTAPAAGVELISPMRIHSVRVTSGGEPVRDATVKFAFPSGGSVAGPTDENGDYSMILATTDRTAYGFTVSKPGFDTLDSTIVPADLDETRTLTVDIAKLSEPSHLVLDLMGPGGPTGPCYMRLVLQDEDFYVFRQFSETPRAVEIGELPPGRYVATIEPSVHVGIDPATLGRWRSTEAEFVCEAGARERHRIELVPGGRLVFDLRARARAASSPWTLSGPGDTRLGVLRWSEADGRSTEAFGGDEITADGTYWLRQVLVPGTYRLEIPRETGAPFEREFDVAPGELVRLDVSLDS